jgi:signal transduction histidine kinase
MGPALAGLRLRLDTALALLDRDPEQARARIAEAVVEVGQAEKELRRVIDDLGPGDLSCGLPGALRRLAARLGPGTYGDVVVDVPDLTPALAPEVEVAAYRIASEGLTNVIRHASARRVTLRLARLWDTVVLEVSDDGVGQRAYLCSGGGLSGVGTASMSRRAREVGGRCDVLSRPDGRPGTLVRAILPGRAA